MVDRRVVCWFSCGAASAVATKLAIDKYKNQDIHVVYCASTLSTEHPDNNRFLKDCENWFGIKIELLYSDKYKDIWDVFERGRYLSGPTGAKCTTYLKKKVRQKYQKPNDIQVFGFDILEIERFINFKENNPDIFYPKAPLIDNQITKAESFLILKDNNIDIPQMYKMGYKNNNCIGCVKGGMGYWNKIRKDFPEIFDKMAKIERKLNKSIIMDNQGKKIFLDELKENVGRYEQEPDIQCGIWCASN